MDVPGALSLSRTSDIVNHLVDDPVTSSEITIDIDSKKLHVGNYVCKNSNWTFSFDSFSSNSVASLLSCDDDCYGIIDAASPYLIFAMSTSSFSSLWKNIGGNGNCDKSTLECDSKSDIAYYLEFTIGNDSFYMERDD